MGPHAPKKISGLTDLKVEHIVRENGHCVLKIEGTLDATTAADLDARIRPLLDPQPSRLLFDFGGLDYISSMGLGVVLKTAVRLKSAGAECWVYDPQLPVRRVLEIAKWGHLIVDPASVPADFAFFGYICDEEPARAARRAKSASKPPRLYGERA